MSFPVPATLEVKWKGEVLLVDVGLINEICVAEVKHELFSLTEVLPERQKLLMKGKTWSDDATLDFYVKDLYEKETAKMPTKLTEDTSSTTVRLGVLTMLGSREADLAFVVESSSDIADDFDDDDDSKAEESGTIPPQDLLKIQKRVERPDDYIEVVNPPRPGKKLLVLDIDYTFFDHRSPAESPEQLRRPHLHEFLTSVYTGGEGLCAGYDIGIWSATSRKWIDVKLLELGVSNSSSYKISVIMDARSMISIHSAKYKGVVRIKPLEVLWRYAAARGYGDVYHKNNTIMFDDLGRNMCYNAQQGLKIRPFRNGPSAEGRSDKELMGLEKYLLSIGSLGDEEFGTLNHKKWESYIGMKRRKKGIEESK